MTVSVSETIIEIEKTVRNWARTFSDLVARGRLKQETADHKLACMRNAQSILTWLEPNMDWIKAEAIKRRHAAEQERELAEIEKLPEVAAVREAFPGATVKLTEPA